MQGVYSCRGWRQVEADTSWVGEAVMVMSCCPGANYCRMLLHGCDIWDTSEWNQVSRGDSCCPGVNYYYRMLLHGCDVWDTSDWSQASMRLV